MGNNKINFLKNYIFHVIDVFKEDKFSDIYGPNVQSGIVLRQPVSLVFLLEQFFHGDRITRKSRIILKGKFQIIF